MNIHLVHGFMFYAAMWALVAAVELVKMHRSHLIVNAFHQLQEGLMKEPTLHHEAQRFNDEVRWRVAVFLFAVVFASAIGSVWWIWIPLQFWRGARGDKGGGGPDGHL